MTMTMFAAACRRTTFRLTTTCLSSRLTVGQNYRLASTLVVSDPLLEGGVAPPATLSAWTAAQKLGSDDIALLVVGDTPPTKLPPTNKVIFAKTPSNPTAETIAAAVKEATTEETKVVLGTSSKFGATVMPRAAALLDASPITDIVSIESPGTCVHLCRKKQCQTMHSHHTSCT